MELYGAAGVLINADGFLEVALMVDGDDYNDCDYDDDGGFLEVVHVEMITMIVITTMMTTKMDVSSKVTRMNITADVSGEIKLHLNNLYG